MKVFCKRIMYLPDSLIILFEKDKWYEIDRYNEKEYHIKSEPIWNTSITIGFNRFNSIESGSNTKIHKFIPINAFIFSDYFNTVVELRKKKLNEIDEKKGKV